MHFGMDYLQTHIYWYAIFNKAYICEGQFTKHMYFKLDYFAMHYLQTYTFCNGYIAWDQIDDFLRLNILKHFNFQQICWIYL